MIFGKLLYLMTIRVYDVNSNAWSNVTTTQSPIVEKLYDSSGRWSKYRLALPNQIATNRIHLQFVSVSGFHPEIDALLLIGQGFFFKKNDFFDFFVFVKVVVCFFVVSKPTATMPPAISNINKKFLFFDCIRKKI